MPNVTEAARSSLEQLREQLPESDAATLETDQPTEVQPARAGVLEEAEDLVENAAHKVEHAVSSIASSVQEGIGKLIGRTFKR